MKRILSVLAVIIVLSLTYGFNRPDGRVHVSFLDVGQGDAVLIQQGSFQALIDGGPSPQALLTELGRRLPFWDRTIEFMVLTHPHRDHLAGLVEVLKRYSVKIIIQPRDSWEDNAERDSGLVAEWRRLLAEKHTQVIDARAHQELTAGDLSFAVLSPRPELLSGVASDADGSAVVLEVRSGARSFLLTSDLGREGESELLSARLVAGCDVLKIAHHGSDGSTSPEFLNVARPEVAVISVGENDYGHPGQEVLERLAGLMVYRTDTDGTVEFITDGLRLWLKTGR